ncbi:MAG: ATPase [Bacteroidetes bacterium HGW-Bacteroidetes-4]|jgi:nicotinamide riboside kinase|nr:MAG: ATPase [Bacteroidetes bacterium HGW-Bacteroidetes-4]
MDKRKFRYPYIVITGPESTGKTELAAQLAQNLNCRWIPELSRDYIANLGRPYQYADVERIARLQIARFTNELMPESAFAVFDTGLIITKVWFDVVYKKCPDWLIEAIQQQPKVFHLVCNTDLPWIADPVRENGGAMREKLLETYQYELKGFGFPHALVSGNAELRLQNALKLLKQHLIL